MDETEPVPDQTNPEISETKEEIPETEEQKVDGTEEESNKESDEPQEGGITGQEAEEEAAPEQASVKDAEEEPPTQNQETEETLIKEAEEEPPTQSQETEETPIKEAEEEPPTQSQETEETPVKEAEEEALSQDQETEIPDSGLGEDADQNVKTAGDTETEQDVVQEYFHSSQDFGEQPQGDGQPAKVKESQPNVPEEQNLQAKEQPSATNEAIPSLMQLTSEIRNEEKTVWINPKTGKEMKCSFNQTSLVWEKKPLADILRSSGIKSETLSWECGNGGASTFSKRIHIPYNPEDPEWAGYPNPFEY